MRVRKTPFVMDWEENKQDKIKELTGKGVIPVGYEDAENRPYLMGVVAAEVKTIEPAKKIVEVSLNGHWRNFQKLESYVCSYRRQDMVKEAVQRLQRSSTFIVSQSKL